MQSIWALQVASFQGHRLWLAICMQAPIRAWRHKFLDKVYGLAAFNSIELNLSGKVGSYCLWPFLAGGSIINIMHVCRPAFLGNSMTQYSPDGNIMFLHTNLSPKWNLELPGDFSEYRRRWKV